MGGRKEGEALDGGKEGEALAVGSGGVMEGLLKGREGALWEEGASLQSCETGGKV